MGAYKTFSTFFIIISLALIFACNSNINKGCNPQELLEAKAYDAAIQCADSILSRDPVKVEVIKIKALSLANTGKFEEAKNLYSQIISIHIHDQKELVSYVPPYNYYIDRAYAYVGMGLKDSALKDVTFLQQLNPTDNLRSYFFYEKAQIHNQFLDTALVVLYLDSAIALDNTYFKAYKHRAQVNKLLGYKAEAYADISKAIQLEPENAEVVNLKALFHYQDEELEELIEAFSKAVQLDPQNSIYRFNLAKAYHKFTALPLACDEYTVYLSIGGEPDKELEDYCASWHQAGYK